MLVNSAIRRKSAQATQVDSAPIATATTEMKTMRQLAVKSPSASGSTAALAWGAVSCVGSMPTAGSPAWLVVAAPAGLVDEEHGGRASVGAHVMDHGREVGREPLQPRRGERAQGVHQARLERFSCPRQDP